MPRKATPAQAIANPKGPNPAVNARARRKLVGEITEPKQTMPPAPSDAEIRQWIAEAAYYRAQQRGFLPGGEEADWLEAEAQVTARIRER